VLFPIEASVGEGFFHELANGVGFTSADDEIIGFFLLEDCQMASMYSGA